MKSITGKVVLALSLAIVALSLPAHAQNENPQQLYDQLQSLNDRALNEMREVFDVDSSAGTVVNNQLAPSPGNQSTDAANILEGRQSPWAPDAVIVPWYPGCCIDVNPDAWQQFLNDFPGAERTDPFGNTVYDAPENEPPSIPDLPLAPAFPDSVPELP